MLQKAIYGYVLLGIVTYHANEVSEVYSRFGVGIRGIYFERHRSGLINLLSLPSAFIIRSFLSGLTECFDRVRAILLLMNKPRKSCWDSSMDP